MGMVLNVIEDELITYKQIRKMREPITKHVLLIMSDELRFANKHLKLKQGRYIFVCSWVPKSM